ncbi:MAG TPA: hypothetical protein VMV53_04140 [Acidimicrobiales bacterium]|nr:hypothetical protein [Acidimicrobiales bacterium]
MRGGSRRSLITVLVQGVLVTSLIVVGAPPAFAAPHHGGGGGGGGGSGPITTGNDISYPQCGGSMPSGQAFGIVGVNGGLANNPNACLGPSSQYPNYAQSELYWASVTSTGVTAQPAASLYVNTADPGNLYNGILIGDWPSSSTSGDPYGTCTPETVTTSSGPASAGANSPACAWQYGFNVAAQDMARVTAAADAIDAQVGPGVVSDAASSYPWWLDVETANSWQSGTTGLEMNVADLQGMVAAFAAAGATVGAYSTSSQWNQITGGTNAVTLYNVTNSLYQIPEWVPGARSRSAAVSNCAQATFTGGVVTLTQWFGHPFDGDYVC